MFLREPCLPAGWYPRDRRKIGEFLTSFAECPVSAKAAVAPHAGWYFSGHTAALAVSSLRRDAETVVVIGGHLPERMSILTAEEEGVKTPFGVMNIDRELREALKKKLSIRSDSYPDNTVEVLLPMVHHFFPHAELLWLRFPAALSTWKAGRILAETAGNLGRRIAVLASTDLTHYGPNYGFSPGGAGKAALEWVRKNDAAFIAAVISGDPAEVVERAENDFSACSAGAVLGALGFIAASPEVTQSRLLEYRTSVDAENSGGEEIPASFVGYAAISLGQT